MIGLHDEIVAAVHHERAVGSGEVIEVGSDPEDKDEGPGKGVEMSNTKMMKLCEQLEKSILTSTAESSLEVSQALQRVRVQLSRIEFLSANQVTLESLWGKSKTKIVSHVG